VSTELEEKVIAVIQANIENKYDVHLQSDLRTDLEVDSFGAIMIFNDLEETFGIEIKDADIKSIVKVADIVHLLATKYLQSAENL
jgi:acyl carrier protein